MIHFVGSGSGAVDLITVRGAKLLNQADVIIYAGSLVNPQLLDEYARKDCKIYNSAKLHLDEVIYIMVEAEKNNLTTVRLHTGDSSIYGAIREQMDRLQALNIPYDVCPGVSSFCGMASSLKCEYTLPNVSQTVIITRMEGRTPVPEREKISELAKHGSTMIIFLSTGLLKELSTELINGGYSPDTQAVIVYKATWQDEKICYCTVESLYQTAKDNDITKTALIGVGGFLGNAYELSKLYDKHFSTNFRKGTPYENSDNQFN